MSCFESSRFLKNSNVMNREVLTQACDKLKWRYTVNSDEVIVYGLDSKEDLRGEYALKVKGNQVTYNTYYLKNAGNHVQNLKDTFYELNIKYSEEAIIREFKRQGWQYKSNDKFKPTLEEKVSFFMVGRSKLKEEDEQVAQIKFTILNDGSVITDSDYIPKDIHELADKAMESLENALGNSRIVTGKEIPLKYKHKTFCENRKVISIKNK